MPVIEIATFKLIDPNISIRTHTDIRTLLSTGSKHQASWSFYPLHFFVDSKDESIVYLISGWSSVSAHTEWIQSEENKRVMGPLGQWVAVESLVHLDMDFENFPDNVEVVIFKKWDKGSDSAAGVPDLASVIWQAESSCAENTADVYWLAVLANGEDRIDWADESYRTLRRIRFD